MNGNSHYKRVAGLNESACLLKQQVSFWHQLWVDIGYPSGGVIAAIRKKAKQRYKAEARHNRVMYDVRRWKTPWLQIVPETFGRK